MNKTILAVVNNEPDVLMRVTGLLRRKGLSMKNIAMGETDKPSVAYLIVTLRLDNENLGQILNNLKKLVDVYSVEEVDSSNLGNMGVLESRTAVSA
jgi:acetolactate synthase-1/3 small subunit